MKLSTHLLTEDQLTYLEAHKRIRYFLLTIYRSFNVADTHSGMLEAFDIFVRLGAPPVTVPPVTSSPVTPEPSVALEPGVVLDANFLTLDWYLGQLSLALSAFVRVPVPELFASSHRLFWQGLMAEETTLTRMVETSRLLLTNDVQANDTQQADLARQQIHEYAEQAESLMGAALIQLIMELHHLMQDHQLEQAQLEPKMKQELAGAR